MSDNGEYQWDFFVSHATEDKDDIANDLATVLKQDYRVWYDKDILKIGDSLRRTIENGLSKSQFGVVIISPNFIGKKWPEAELDVLWETKRIFPVLHNITVAEAKSAYPTLLNLFALSAEIGPRKLARKIIDASGLPTRTAILEDKISKLFVENLSFEEQLNWTLQALNTLSVLIAAWKESGANVPLSILVAKILADLLVVPGTLIRLAAEKEFPLTVYSRDSGSADKRIYDSGSLFYIKWIRTSPKPDWVELHLSEMLNRDWLISEQHEKLSLSEFIWVMSKPLPQQYSIISHNLAAIINGVQAPVHQIFDLGELVLELGHQFKDFVMPPA
jgi:TIR domain